jgi:hypothetical protein
MQPTKCSHPHVVIHTTGSITFEAGDINDTRESVLVCTACGQEIQTEEDFLELETSIPWEDVLRS